MNSQAKEQNSYSNYGIKSIFLTSTFKQIVKTTSKSALILLINAEYWIMSAGLSLFGAVSAGQEAAVQFYQDHVAEVKRIVPKDKLLVFEVKQGWQPLCDFLNVPVPENPFPRINDTEAMNEARR